jgi:hypothetical protein
MGLGPQVVIDRTGRNAVVSTHYRNCDFPGIDPARLEGIQKHEEIPSCLPIEAIDQGRQLARKSIPVSSVGMEIVFFSSRRRKLSDR